MGVYTRFKRSSEGFRALVELLESTPLIRRQKMIEVGMQEDPVFTERALQYVLSFQDVLNLPDLELAEVLAKAPPKMTAFAISALSDEIKLRFLRNAQPRIAADIKDMIQIKIGPREIGGAQLKLITVTRELERGGLVKAKAIPT